ncbi:hypothetical protein [uncultured Duncaniella sp.]|uniref:hypothetical protein n=1 Tax=uncultured Duncaniella sp. TaxID=2768039 RepID=UPI0027121498|nr:hypothetical protein [uncultured Duncaniella sp.]
MEERSVKRENAVAAYNVANDETKKVLVALLGEDFCKPKDIRERVKTLEDAISILGGDHPYVKHLTLYEQEMHGNVEKMEDISAFLKLRVITTALNEGWEPQFIPNEKRWYPWFDLYTQEEIDRMSDEEKKEVGLVLWGGHANYGSYCGLGIASSRNAFSNASAYFGSRLAFKSEELADYAGRQFFDICADFCFKPEKPNAE